MLPFPLAVSSLGHHNIISSWIMEIFWGLLTSTLTNFRRFPSKGKWFYVTQAKLRSQKLTCIWWRQWQKCTVPWLLVACLHTATRYGWLILCLALSQSRISYLFSNIILKWSIAWDGGANLAKYIVLSI